MKIEVTEEEARGIYFDRHWEELIRGWKFWGLFPLFIAGAVVSVILSFRDINSWVSCIPMALCAAPLIYSQIRAYTACRKYAKGMMASEDKKLVKEPG